MYISYYTGYQAIDMMAPARDFGSAHPVQKKRYITFDIA